MKNGFNPVDNYSKAVKKNFNPKENLFSTGLDLVSRGLDLVSRLLDCGFTWLALT